ncbi:MAG: GDP-mannose 4,6-dehydratase, partial [Verrucomicrobia bacterium]|nr:GDP-mannose 4,6-dehydratase [Verrucomicrobiota bacterium]
YNLAAMSHVAVSFENPEYTSDIDAIGTLRILEAMKNTMKYSNKVIKFYQAGTSELYGGIYDKPQNEETPFYPHSPYAVAKLYGYWITKNYRESYNLFAVNGILFNHTSPRRGETFVEQKIVKAAVAILNNKQDCLYLGNIYSYRDFGHAKDYVNAMWLMLQDDTPDDYVIATGSKYMIKDIVSLVFNKLGMQIEWSGEGTEEIGVIRYSNKVVVRINKKYYRPNDVDSLIGDATKALNKLKWNPEYTFESIINEMITEEIKRTNMEINNIEEVMHLCEKYNLPIYTELILGLPKETLDTWRETYWKLFRMGNHYGITAYQSQLLENAEMNLLQKKLHKIESTKIYDYFSSSYTTDDPIKESIRIVTATKDLPKESMIDAM